MGVAGAVAWTVGVSREQRKGADALAREKSRHLRHEQRTEDGRQKALARARGLRGSLNNLAGALQVEVPQPLAVSASFAHMACVSGDSVNIAAWGDEGFLFCDYSNVFYVDEKTWQVRQIAKPEIKGIWFPTGLATVRNDKTVLVANYRGHNVLEFRFFGGRLELQHTYEIPGMKSPEGVAVSRDGRLVGVADYDGDRLWVFQRRGPLAWEREIGKAHGVAFSADSVYVTSLKDRTIAQFALDGAPRRKIGKLGWREAEFLWPTSVFADEQGVVVSDAHTGKVSLFSHDLAFVSSFGGNGPGMGLFNKPYCTIRLRDQFWICDSFKRRILQYHPVTGIERQFSALPPVAPQSPTPVLARPRWEYSDFSSPSRGVPPQLPAGLIVADYGRLVHLDEQAGEWRSLTLPVDYSSLWSPHELTYFTWLRAVKQGDATLVAIGASSHPGIFVLHPDGRCALENDWGRSPLQAGPHGVYELDGARFDLDVVAASAMEKFSRHASLLGRGTTRLEAARAVFWPKLSAADFAKSAAAEFRSETGRRFWTAFSAAAQPAAEETAANEFDQTIAQTRGELSLAELWLRNVLVLRSSPQR